MIGTRWAHVKPVGLPSATSADYDLRRVTLPRVHSLPEPGTGFAVTKESIMSSRRAVALVATVSLLLSAALAMATPQKITTLEGITEYRLDNGLTVLLCPDPSKPTLTVNATYLVGSRHEGYGETGMAHLLEHMLFKGTPDHPNIWKILQEHGARFNGSTWFDRTNYFETLPASPENLRFALELEADRMVNSTIAAADLASEFSVVRNEFEIGENDPMGVLSERVMSTAYLWHNYGKSTIGSREDIENVPVVALREFYEKYYQPDNCVLIVAGRFDETAALKDIDETFGAIPRPERELLPTYTWEPTQDGEREVTLRRVGDIQGLDVVYHVCAGPHPDYPAIAILADILDADQTGRLYQALIEPGLATRVSSQAMALHDPGVLEISVETGTDQDLEVVRTRLLETLDGLRSASFTEAEVERAKNARARRFESLINDSNRIGVVLSESAAMGDWRLMFFNRDRLARVTPADVQRVASHYLAPSNRTVGSFVPDKSPDRTEIPHTPDLNELLKDYEGGEAVAIGEAFDATYEAIEAHTQRGEIAPGIHYAFVPKQTRNARVNVVMNFHYGSLEALTGHRAAVQLAPAMLMRGTREHSRRQIQDAFDALKAQVRVGSAGGRRGRGGGAEPGTIPVSIECSRENLAPVLDLVGEILREPAFPADEFETLKRERITRLQAQMSEPMGLVMVELRRHLNPYPPEDFRSVPSLEEQLQQLEAATVDETAGLYRSLVGASHVEVAAVGDFDPNELRQSLSEHFGDWKSPAPYARIEQEYRPVAPEVIVLETPDKANALFALGQTIEIRDDDPDYPALFMANYILGANPSSRFMTRIRQKEGLSYGCGTMLQANSQDRVGAFLGFGMCAPQNAQRAMEAGLEEIQRFLDDGVDEQELADAKSGYAQQLEVGLANDASVASMLAEDLQLGRTLHFRARLRDRILALTPEEVRSALAAHVDPSALLRMRAGDFADSERETGTR